MNPLAIRILAVVIFAAVCFGTGWRVKAAFVAESELAAQQARVEMISLVRAEEGRVAAVVEERLKELRANERTIEREKIKVVENPVYKNECLDYDGVNLINRARTGGHPTGAEDSKLDGSSETGAGR